MAAFVRRQVGLERVGQTVDLPSDPAGRLMYYMQCVANVLELNDANSSRFTAYNNWYLLDDNDERTLLMLCVLFSPDELIGKVFFPSDQMCGNSNNAFYNINQVNHIFAVSGAVLVGGQQKRVTKIMAFKHSWMQQNYFSPLQQLHGRIQRRNAAAARAAPSQSCVIL